MAAAAIGRGPPGGHPGLEIDGVGSSRCMEKTGALGQWEADLNYEATQLGNLPHTVVYLEGGYSDGNPPGYTARVLNAAGVGKIRGFFTNDTHINWTIDEVHWAEKVSAMTHGANFIVNTAQNGNGPLRPHNRVNNGNEVLCNPPGRAMGPAPTTTTGFAHADAFLWTGPPGNSSGSCNGGTAAGTFWEARGVQSSRVTPSVLGPGFPGWTSTNPESTRQGSAEAPAAQATAGAAVRSGALGGGHELLGDLARGVWLGDRRRRAGHRRQAAVVGQQLADLGCQPCGRELAVFDHDRGTGLLHVPGVGGLVVGGGVRIRDQHRGPPRRGDLEDRPAGASDHQVAGEQRLAEV